MRILVASLIVLSVLYYWDDSYNHGKFLDGLRSMGRSISHNMALAVPAPPVPRYSRRAAAM